jgi:enoyl-CoA hydratase/carnithine racemase
VDAPELIIDTSAAGIATFVLNRPAELNAWTYPLEESFFAALDSAAGDPGARVVVVTGAGRGFCAGASMQLLGDGDRRRARTASTPSRMSTRSSAGTTR